MYRMSCKYPKLEVSQIQSPSSDSAGDVGDVGGVYLKYPQVAFLLPMQSEGRTEDH